MTIILRHYSISLMHLASLATEFYGRLLQACGTDNSVDFEFESETYAKQFRRTLDGAFKKGLE